MKSTWLAALGSAVCACSTSAAAAQGTPQQLAAAQVDARPGEQVVLDVMFQTPSGERVALSKYVQGDVPVYLVLAYARCTMLCSLVLQGAAEAIRGQEALEIGEDFRAVLVSIDPREEPSNAARKQASMLEDVGAEGRPERFPYLIGKEPQIRALADSLGFRYAWDPASQQYAHPAVTFVLTPDGRISRYLYGLRPGAQALSRALEAARDGEVVMQSDATGVLLRCFHFIRGFVRYSAAIELYLRVGAALVLLGLIVLVARLSRRPRRLCRE